ncbi:hypothetical protein Tco_0982733 [Tanacetum coccineum]
MFAVKRLLARAVLNAEVGVTAIPTLPFVTASVSSTSKRKGRDHTNSVAGINLRATGAPPRFIISSDSSHHSGTNVAEAKVDSLIRSSVLIMTTATTITSMVDPILVAKEKLVEPSIVTNGSRLDDGRVCRGMVDEFAPPKFFAFVRGMKHDQLFTEFNVGAARQMSLSAEVRMRAEYNVKEKRRLESVVERQGKLLKVREEDIENLKAQLLLREAEVAEAIRLRAEASNFEVVEKSLRDETNALKERNAILEKERNALDVKVTKLETSAVGKERELTNLNALITFVKSQNDNLVDQVHELETSSFGHQEKLYTDFVEMALHLEENFYPHLHTTIFSRKWLLTQGMELAIIKCLNSPKYLSALGAAIGKAIKKGMQDRLSGGITHVKEGRVFTDVAAHNPSSNKDASIETVMDSLCLEDPLAEKLGLNELQPNVDQLMVPIHHSSDKVVVGASALSLALDVSSIRVRKIRENIPNQRLALRDVFVPLAEPFSAAVLTGTEGTSDTADATVDPNTALSTTFASAISIYPISVDDYEVVGADDQAVADENATPFPNVDDAELNIPQ